MKVSDFCTREMAMVEGEFSVAEAAEMMAARRVGSVLVVDQLDAPCKPVGIISDGDLVAEIVAANRDSEALTAAELMSSDLVLVRDDQTLWEAAELMREEGIRQVPVVDLQGDLVGLFCMEDLLQVVTEELTQLMLNAGKAKPDLSDRV